MAYRRTAPEREPEHAHGTHPALHQLGGRRVGAGARIAAEVSLTGEIEGRIIFDLDPETAARVAQRFSGTEVPESDDLVRETVCELANQIIGNAITSLNDQGFHFHVHPPALHTSDHGSKSSEDTEALVMCFNTASGNVFMNVALRYNRRRRSAEHAPVA